MEHCAPNSCNYMPAVSHTKVYWDFGGKAEGIIVSTKREAYVCTECGDERPALIWSEPKKTLDGTIITKCNHPDFHDQGKILVKIKGGCVTVNANTFGQSGLHIRTLMRFELDGVMGITDIQVKAANFHYNHFKQGRYELPA